MALEIYVLTLNTFLTFNPVLCYNLIPQDLSSAVTFKKLMNIISVFFSFDLNLKIQNISAPRH